MVIDLASDEMWMVLTHLQPKCFPASLLRYEAEVVGRRKTDSISMGSISLDILIRDQGVEAVCEYGRIFVC